MTRKFFRGRIRVGYEMNWYEKTKQLNDAYFKQMIGVTREQQKSFVLLRIAGKRTTSTYTKTQLADTFLKL